MKQCSNCHAQYDDAKTYCGNCGKPLFVVQEQVQPVPQPVPQPAPQPVPPPAPQPIPQPIPQPVPQPIAHQAQKPPVKKKSRTIQIVILAVLGLSLIGNAILGICLYDSCDDVDYYYHRYSSIRYEHSFYRENARIVDGSIYHKYSCNRLYITDDCRIIDRDLAKLLASPCQSYCGYD